MSLKKKLEQDINLHDIKQYYYPDKNKIFFNGDREELLKAVIIEKLSAIDRNIIILFLENNCSMSETAKVFNCSTTLLATKIKEIKEKIKTCLQEIFLSTYC